MNTLLWILQIVLAVVFAGAGITKVVLPQARLSATLGDWIDSIHGPLISLLGLAEVFGAVGLIVPPLVGTAPILVAFAACGLAVTMIGAIVIHARRREYPNVAVNVLLGVMAVVVAWGRFGPYAF